MTAQEDANGWACQHAMSLVSNVTVEAWACGYSIKDEAATIANEHGRQRGEEVALKP